MEIAHSAQHLRSKTQFKMTWWTTCNTQYRKYDLPDDADGKAQGVKCPLRRFLPVMSQTPENLEQVKWHFAQEPCTEASLRPLADIMTGNFTPGPDDRIHLHGAPMGDVGAVSWETKMKHGLERGLEVIAGNPFGRIGGNETDGNANAGVAHGKGLAGSGDGQGGGDDVGDGGKGKGKGNDNDNINEGNDDDVQESAESDPETLTLVSSFVERKFKKEEPRRYREMNQADREQTILLKPELQHNCPLKQHAFTFDDSGIPRVAAINDLLDDETVFLPDAGVVFTEDNTGTERQLQPQLTIMLTLKQVAKRNTAAEPFIIIRSGAETMNSGGVAWFYRIGSNPGTTKFPIPSTYFWCCTLRNDTSDVKLVQAASWSLRGLTICKPDEGSPCSKKQIELEEKDKVGPTTRHDFLHELQNGSIRPDNQGRLLYDFGLWNREVARTYNVQPIKRFPGYGITVAVRYVNHLQDGLELWSDESYELAKHEDDAVFREEVKKFLSERGTSLGTFEGRWDIELWVMPQIPNGRTLFKFRKSSRMADWLHQPYVDDGDAVLFAEVHIIPVVAK